MSDTNKIIHEVHSTFEDKIRELVGHENSISMVSWESSNKYPYLDFRVWADNYMVTKTRFNKKTREMDSWVEEGYYPISYFTLTQMPGCCGVCISTGSFVMPEFRGRGVGTLLNELRIELAKALGYGLLFCTDVDSNEPQKSVLNKNGWDQIYQFTNPRTGNMVNMHVYNLVEGNS